MRRVDPVPIDHRSYCRICAAACGIVVTVEGDRVMRVRGDADPLRCRGDTCAPRDGACPIGTPRAWPPRSPAAPRRGRGLGRPARRSRPGHAPQNRRARPRCDRVVPRHGPGLRQRRAGCRRHVDGSHRQLVLLHSCDGRQRPDPGGGGAGDRAADAEPGLGSVVAGPAAPRRHQPGRVARVRHDAARPGSVPP